MGFYFVYISDSLHTAGKMNESFKLKPGVQNFVRIKGDVYRTSSLDNDLKETIRNKGDSFVVKLFIPFSFHFQFYRSISTPAVMKIKHTGMKIG